MFSWSVTGGVGWGRVGWGGTITFMFLCTHRHSNLIIFLAVLQTQALLFHAFMISYRWGGVGWDKNVLTLSCRHWRDGHARTTQRMPIQKESCNGWLRWTFFNYWRCWWWGWSWWWWWRWRWRWGWGWDDDDDHDDHDDDDDPHDHDHDLHGCTSEGKSGCASEWKSGCASEWSSDVGPLSYLS